MSTGGRALPPVWCAFFSCFSSPSCCEGREGGRERERESVRTIDQIRLINYSFARGRTEARLTRWREGRKDRGCARDARARDRDAGEGSTAVATRAPSPSSACRFPCPSSRRASRVSSRRRSRASPRSNDPIDPRCRRASERPARVRSRASILRRRVARSKPFFPRRERALSRPPSACARALREPATDARSSRPRALARRARRCARLARARGGARRARGPVDRPRMNVPPAGTPKNASPVHIRPRAPGASRAR